MPSIELAIKQAQQQIATVSDSANLDAEILLCFILDKNRAYLRTWPEKPLSNQQQKNYHCLIDQRAEGVPIAYLTGIREFWSRDFIVTSDVLIPRPDTESLIEVALDLIPQQAPFKIIDLGTGSGAIAVTLAAERPKTFVTATDVCPFALAIARQNANKHQLANIQFIESNWFQQVSETDFDMIISNPPYIAINDPHLQLGDLRFEPDCALISENQGLQDICLIVETTKKHLKPNGWLLLEHGYNQQQSVQSILKRCDYHSIQTFHDLSGQPRVTTGQY